MPWFQFSECWVLSQLFHSPLTFIKRLFSSSSLSAIRVVSSAYLRWLILLLAILIPACASSSLVFHMMYSAYKLNKQVTIQPLHIPFPVWNIVRCSMFGSNCCFLTCIQVSQEADKVVWFSHLSKNIPVCCDPHSQRLWCSQYGSSCFSGMLLLFLWSNNVGDLISGTLALSKSSLNLWEFLVNGLLKSS